MAEIIINLPDPAIDEVFEALNGGGISPIVETKGSKVSHIKFYLMGILTKLVSETEERKKKKRG